MHKEKAEIIETLKRFIKEVAQTKESTEQSQCVRADGSTVPESEIHCERCEKMGTLLKELTDSEFASVLLFNPEKQQLYTRTKNKIELSIAPAKGCIGRVFLTKTPAIYNHLISDKEYVQSVDNPLNHRLRSQMLRPILKEGELLGIVRVSRTAQGTGRYYTADDQEVLSLLDSYLAEMIEAITKRRIPVAKEPSVKEIEEKLQESHTQEDDKSLLLFLSNTIHDIRTPANSLYGFLELLEEQIEDRRLKEFVTNAKESAGFINSLTDSILAKTKNRYEGSISKQEVVNSVKFISDIANIFSSRVSEKQIAYYIHIDPTLPKELQIDKLKLKRVLINLIGNAYKFTPKGERIDLRVRYDSGQKRMHISVKDTGIGIEEENQKKLFEAFTQARDDTSMEYGGSGLGLAICAEYVAEFGGELKLKSRVGEGSEFFFDMAVNIIDETPSYPPFYNFKKKIVILTDKPQSDRVAHMVEYLTELAMPIEKIVISDTIPKDVTHLICFEHKITDEVLSLSGSSQVEVLLIEEQLFSLLNKKENSHFHIVAENTYYEHALHALVYSGKQVKILIVDDNRINVRLLESILGTECGEMISTFDGATALTLLKEAVEEHDPFDVLYLDKHMVGLSGTELLRAFRAYEKSKGIPPLFVASISGDPEVLEEERELYDVFVTKPFSKKEVRSVIQIAKDKGV